MIVGFDPRRNGDGCLPISGMEELFDALVENRRDRSTRHGVEAAAQVGHSFGVGPGAQVGVLTLTFEGGQSVVGANLGDRVIDEFLELAEIHRGGRTGEFGGAGEESLSVGAGLLESTAEQIEVSRGGAAFGEHVTDGRGEFGDVRSVDGIAGLSGTHAGVGHEFVFGNHESRIRLVGEQCFHARDQGDLTCDESSLLGARDSELSTNIADVHHRDLEQFRVHDVERTQGV